MSCSTRGEQFERSTSARYTRSRLTVLLAIILACTSGWMFHITSSHPATVGWAATNGDRVKVWFERYDSIRRTAQMSPQEKKMADDLLSKKIGLLLPGFGRLAAHRLLKKMIVRYDAAVAAMRELPALPETKELHDGYTKYFNTAGQVFQASMKQLNNPLRSRRELEDRKQELADMDESLKSLDKQLRDSYNIPPYTYKTAASN